MRDFLELLENGFSIGSLVQEISLQGLLATLAVALLCSFVVYLTYRFFYNGIVYSENFNLLLVMVALITAFVIMTISTNIVLSLGMVGALSIVRFRAAVKDPLDIGFLFWSIGVGITAGAGLYLVAGCSTLSIALIYTLMTFIKSERRNFLLIVRYNPEEEDFVNGILKTLRYKLKNKTMTENFSELTVEIKIKKQDTSFLKKFTANPNVQSAVILEYTGEYTG